MQHKYKNKFGATLKKPKYINIRIIMLIEYNFQYKSGSTFPYLIFVIKKRI